MRFVTLPRAHFYLAGNRRPRLSAKDQERLQMLSGWQALRQQGLNSTQASQNLEVSHVSLFRWQLQAWPNHSDPAAALTSRPPAPDTLA
jgi:hypothetical protein